MEEADEKPHTIRRVLGRFAATLLAVLLVYVLGSGPAAYYVMVHFEDPGGTKSQKGVAFLIRFYGPLIVVAERTPAGYVLIPYVTWWMERAPQRALPSFGQ